jgi:hypothetical protein
MWYADAERLLMAKQPQVSGEGVERTVERTVEQFTVGNAIWKRNARLSMKLGNRP